MKFSLPANISRLRKENAMTQEQLAEALGVTFASVSKWERGAATPELKLIAEMADLFEVSIDALIGYEFRNNDRENVIARLKQYSHDRNREDMFPDIEKALRRYPNCFDVVYYSARIYSLRGLTGQNAAYAKKALSLYDRACMLIRQNTDPEISDISIRKEMAQIHLALGAYDKGIELLKQNDPCRMNYPLIGATLASSCNDPEGAMPYLSMALLDLTVTHTEIVMGYLNAFCKTEDYLNALAFVDWALAFYPGLKAPGKRSYMDKNEAFLWAIRADIQMSSGRTEEAADSLRQAKEIAQRFDEAPDYSASSIRFVSGRRPATAFDDLGDTAMIGLDAYIAGQEKRELLELWRKVKNEG